MLRITNATANDIPVIRALTFSIWPDTYYPIIGEQQVAYMLKLFYTPAALAGQMQNGQQYILCYDGDIAVGFGSYSLAEPGVYKLNKLYVLTNQQGKGTGKFMLAHICNTIKAAGATHLRLNVNIYNTGAIAFYEKIGFYRFKEEDIDIGGGYFMNDYVLEIAV